MAESESSMTVGAAVSTFGVTALTFGVGGNVGFEKLVAFANKDIHVEMYDPTPWSVSLIEVIIDRSGRKSINAGTGLTGNTVRNKAVVERIHFNPVAYAPENGILPFYYDPDREPEDETISMQEQSFSLV